MWSLRRFRRGAIAGGAWMLALVVAHAVSDAARAQEAAPRSAASDFDAAHPQLQALIVRLLDANPDVGAARARWGAARAHARGQGAFPDPAIQVRYFALSPETRVGPQEAGIGIQQGIPWKGKRALDERRASHAAHSLGWEALAVEHERVVTLKRAFFDAAYFQEALAINREERGLLERFEKIALKRYSTGQGNQQSAIKVQTEITRLLDREIELHGMLDRALWRMEAAVGDGGPVHLEPVRLEIAILDYDVAELETLALGARPEVHAATERIESHTLEARRRTLDARPDFRVGLEYTAVGRREDRAGRMNPPEGDGQDVVAVVAGVTVPLQRRRIQAGVASAQERVRSGREELAAIREAVRLEIRQADTRLRSLTQRARLHRDVLLPQAGESLASAEAAYVTNRLGFLDLLDAERVLFQARQTLQRMLADLWIAAADLERAVGRPLTFPGEALP